MFAGSFYFCYPATNLHQNRIFLYFYATIMQRYATEPKIPLHGSGSKGFMSYDSSC